MSWMRRVLHLQQTTRADGGCNEHLYDFFRALQGEHVHAYHRRVKRERLASLYRARDTEMRNDTNEWIGTRLTERQPATWKTATDTAVSVLSESSEDVAREAIDQELNRLLESARLGRLNREDKIGVIVALNGCRPERLTLALIRRLSMGFTKDDPLAGAAILKRAWLPPWAFERYLSLRGASPAAIDVAHETPDIRQTPQGQEGIRPPSNSSVEAKMKARIAMFPPGTRHPTRDEDVDHLMSTLPGLKKERARQVRTRMVPEEWKKPGPKGPRKKTGC